jgi:hypothetical protein
MSNMVCATAQSAVWLQWDGKHTGTHQLLLHQGRVDGSLHSAATGAA